MSILKLELADDSDQLGGSSARRRFWAVADAGETDEQVRAALLAEPGLVPATVDGNPLTSLVADEVSSAAGLWIFNARYGYSPNLGETSLGADVRDLLAPGATESTRTDRFSGRAPSGFIYASLETKQRIDVLGGDGTGLSKDFGGLINVERDGSKQKVRGLNLQPPPAGVLLDVSVRGAPVSAAAIKNVAAELGTTNLNPFSVSGVSYAAGELLFVQLDVVAELVQDLATGQVGQGTRLSLGWAYARNETGLQVGENAAMLVDKRGHEYLWTYNEPVVQAGVQTLKPNTAFVERVWPESDYAAWMGASSV